MGRMPKTSLHCFRWCRISFQKKTRCQNVTIRRRRYCVRCVLSIRRFMHVLMIAYCIDMSLKKCRSAPGVGYHGTKCRMMTSVAVMKAPRKAPPPPPMKALWYLPIIPRFKRLFSNADDAKDLIWHDQKIPQHLRWGALL